MRTRNLARLPLPAPESGRDTCPSEHRDNAWLFPGGKPGQHVHQSTLMNLLRDAFIDRGAKNASLRALVLQMPAPIRVQVERER